MNESRLEKLADAWRESERFGLDPIDQTAVDRALARQSRDVTRQFRVALTMDIALKAVLAAALAAVLWLLRAHAGLTALNAAVLLATLLCIALEVAALRAIPGGAVAGGSVRSGLEAMLAYYRGRFKRALFLVALSGPLVFYTGVMHYLWYRYGGLRPLDSIDLAVFLGGLAIAYALNAAAQLGQFRLYVNEVEDCLREIEQNGADPSDAPFQRLQARRRRRALAWSLAIALGLLILAWMALK